MVEKTEYAINYIVYFLSNVLIPGDNRGSMNKCFFLKHPTALAFVLLQQDHSLLFNTEPAHSNTPGCETHASFELFARSNINPQRLHKT